MKNLWIKVITIIFIGGSIEYVVASQDSASYGGSISLSLGDEFFSFAHLNQKELAIVPSDDERATFLDAKFQGDLSRVNMPLVIRLTSGFSYRQLKMLVDEVDCLADQEFITMESIRSVKLNILLGLRYENDFGLKINHIFIFNPKIYDLQKTAIHEAGHVVSDLYNDSLKIIDQVTIEPRQITAGGVLSLGAYLLNQDVAPESHDIICDAFLHEIVILLSGGLAEQVFGLSQGCSSEILTQNKDILNFFNQAELSSDIERVRERLRAVTESRFSDKSQDFKESVIDTNIIHFYKQSYKFISDHKDEVGNVATLLLEKGTVSGDEIHDLLKIDKRLYDFESGPLPQRFVGDYTLRGHTVEHEKNVANFDYNNYCTNFPKAVRGIGSPVSAGQNHMRLSQKDYEMVVGGMQKAPINSTYATSDKFGRDKAGRLVEIE